VLEDVIKRGALFRLDDSLVFVINCINKLRKEESSAPHR
jgi:hypothetical protein